MFELDRRKRMLGVVLMAILALTFLCNRPANAQPATCRFVLGFAELRDLLGSEIVGECLEDQSSDAGGSWQVTTGRQQDSLGLMSWQRSTGITFFGSFGHGGTVGTAWLRGPHGLQPRRSDEYYDWEVAGGRKPVFVFARTPRPVGAPLPAGSPPAVPRSVPSTLRERCFSLAAADDIRDRARPYPEGRGTVVQDLCTEAARQDGDPGVGCFGRALEAAVTSGNLVSRVGQITRRETYHACISQYRLSTPPA